MFYIFQFDFMVRAIITGLVVAIIGPIIGLFLVVRRYSLMADTLAHVSLLGVALGVLFKINPYISAVITSVIASISMENLRATKKIYEESVLALFLSGSLALAILILSFTKSFNVNIYGFLFGSISTVTSIDLYIIVGLGLLVSVVFILLYKELFLVAFDEELAQASGIPVKKLNLVFMILVALTVTSTIRIVGILLTGALMVIPVISAIQFELSFKRTLFLSIAFSILVVIFGLFLSYYLDLASGGVIVVLALMLFALSVIYKKLR